MHAQLPRNLEVNVGDNEQAYRWLKFGHIKKETGCKTVANQDKAIKTNYFKNKNLKEETESKCRLCNNVKKLLAT
jgi:hypothetical protein